MKLEYVIPIVIICVIIIGVCLTINTITNRNVLIGHHVLIVDTNLTGTITDVVHKSGYKSSFHMYKINLDPKWGSGSIQVECDKVIDSPTQVYLDKHQKILELEHQLKELKK